MDERERLIEAYRAASAEERRLYELIKDFRPGMQGHNRERWLQWLDAVSRTTAASRALRQHGLDGDVDR